MHITGQLESCTIKSGSITSTNDDLYMDLDDGYVILKNDGKRLGQLMKNKFNGSTQYGVTLDAEYGYYTCLGNKLSSTADEYIAMLTTWGKDTTVNGYKYRKGVNLGDNLWCRGCNINDPGKISWRADSGLLDASDNASIYTGKEGSKSFLCLKIEDDDDDYVCMSCKRSSTNEHMRLADFGWSGNHMYRPLDMHKWEIKNTAIINAASVSANSLYEQSEPVSAYSLATYDEDTDTFTESTHNTVYTRVAKSTQDTITEIGSTKVNKEAKVYLPDGYIYSDYFVQLTPIGDHTCWLDEKADDYFVIKSNDESEFTVDYLITLKIPEQNIATDLMSGSTGYTLKQVANMPEE